MNNKRGSTRLMVFASGTGSDMQAPLYARAGPSYGARVVVVGADRRGAPVIRTAEETGVPTSVRVPSEHPSREEWDESLRDVVVAYKPDIAVLASFLKLVGPEFPVALPQCMVSTHNVLLPFSPEIHGPADALAYGMKVIGVAPFVVDPGMDTGLILGQTTCLVLEGGSEEALVERIEEVERIQLAELIG